MRLLRLLRLFLPEDWAEDVTRDLEEAHARRRRAGGALRAHAWLAWQAAGFACRFTLERALDAAAAFSVRGTLDTLGRDARRALRTMSAAPAFTATVVGTLAIAVGANTAIFSVVRTVLLEPLPYPEAERLVVVGSSPWIPTSMVRTLDDSGSAFEEVAGYYPNRFTLTGGDRPVEVGGAEVTPDLFGVLGADVALGRDFREEDGRADAPRVVVVSHGLWQRRFGGDPAALGRTLRVDDVPHTVVGVMEAGFRQLTPRVDDPELWVPVRPEPGRHSGPEEWLIPLARLAPGATLEQAQDDLDRAVAVWRETADDASDSPRWDLRWATLRANLTGDVRHALLVLQGAVALILLLACVNVANMLLARFASRRSEMAVRTAMGASRGRLFAQLLTESVLLAVAGGVAALVVLVGSLELITALAPPDLPRLESVGVDVPVLLLALGVSLATGILFGVAPALAATRQVPARVLKEGGRSSTGSRARHGLARALVVAQVTLTVVLLVGAGLLVRTFATLSGQHPGFRAEDVLAVPLYAWSDRHATVPELEAFQAELRDAMADVPGVDVVGASNNLPMHRGGSSRLYVVEGEDVEREAQYGVVSPDYFRALEIPLLRGRGVEASDRRGEPAVAVVDEAMSREVWPDRDPLGARIRFVDEAEWMTVVGVSAGIRGDGPGSEPRPGFHISWRQRPATDTELAVGREVFYLVRSGLGAAELAPALRRAVREVDPTQPVPVVRTLSDVLAAEIAPQRFRAILLGAFALMALLLAVGGVYGVIGQLLAERTHELGIRRALGATGGDVVGQVLAWGMRLAAAGIVLGLLGVSLAGRWLESLLFGVTSWDPVTVVGAVALVLAVTAVACLIPARRAARIDALQALRSQG